APNGFAGTLRKRSSPLLNRMRPLDHVSPVTLIRVSPPDVRTVRVGDVELKSKETALMPRSFSANSNHFPDTLEDIGDDDEPPGNLTLRPANRASSWRRAAGFSGRRPGLIAGRSLSQTRFMTSCMLR